MRRTKRTPSGITRSGFKLPGIAVFCGVSLACLASCTAKNSAAGMSTDVVALQAIVHLEVAPAAAKWEIFGTPEYAGGVPGPTDFITLVAELTPFGDDTHVKAAPAGKIWIAPGSARPWLATPFHTMLDKLKNSTADLSPYAHCRRMEVTLKQTGQPVSGFACSDDGKILLYLTIADYSAD